MRVLVSDPLSREAIDLLAKAGLEVLEQHDLAGEHLGVALRDTSALIVRGKTKVTAEVLQHANGLRAVVRAGSGVDNIDLDAARSRGVAVFNTPGANSTSVAELTWGMILALHRSVVAAAQSTSAGKWEKKRFSGFEVNGRTLGVIGYGQIGRQVGAMGFAFGCRVIAHDPYVEFADVSTEAERVDLATLLRESDIVSLHLPLTEETRHLLGAAELASMKTGAVLINCARGGLIDEVALLAKLRRDELLGVGLDAYEQEPPPNRELLSHPRVLATPHIGAATEEAQTRAGIRAAEAVRSFLDSGDAPGRVV